MCRLHLGGPLSQEHERATESTCGRPRVAPHVRPRQRCRGAERDDSVRSLGLVSLKCVAAQDASQLRDAVSLFMGKTASSTVIARPREIRAVKTYLAGGTDRGSRR